MAPTAPVDRHGFQIAIICALDVEADAVHDVLDTFWEDEGLEYDQAFGDNNSYTTGTIGEHNVVLAYMPGIGSIDASTVAANLQSSFRGIKLILLVGVCGGVPSSSQSKEIFLGDLVISTSVIHYDFGKQHPAIFERIDTLEGARSHPSQKIRGVITKLKTRRYYQKIQLEIQQCVQEKQTLRSELAFPGRDQDHLYETFYLHKHHTEDVSSTVTCQSCSRDENWICKAAQKARCGDLHCDPSKRIIRPRHTDPKDSSALHLPDIHFGKIGSGNTVIKSGRHRDELAEVDGVIAFEMESAGIWSQFPSFLMIKGVCDYADSHKNATWQPYAAAVAAAGMKALLNRWTPGEDTVIIDSAASIRSTASTTYGPRSDGINIMYSNARQKRSRQLPSIDSPRFMGPPEVNSPHGKPSGEISLQHLRDEMKNLSIAITSIQSDLRTVLSHFDAPEKDKEEPIHFKDAIGRNYNFPWERAKHWRDMRTLIIQAFEHIEDLGDHVSHGRYDLIGPDKEIIMPEYWDLSVKPGMDIAMMLWPLPEFKPPPVDPLSPPMSNIMPPPQSGSHLPGLHDLDNFYGENGSLESDREAQEDSVTSEAHGLQNSVRKLKNRFQPKWLAKSKSPELWQG